MSEASEHKQHCAFSSQKDTRAIRRVTFVGLLVNLAFFCLKLWIGIVGGSQALVADAVHSLSDSLTDVTILFGTHFWSAPPDAEHPHGHRRIETVITFFIGLALAVVGVLLAVRAVATLHAREQASPSWGVFWVACLSIVVKELIYQWTTRVGRRVRSSSVLANAWHHRSDALSSVPVAVATIGAKLAPDWGFLDYVAAILVAFLILYAACQIAWPAFTQLIDAGAGLEERQRLLSLAETVPGVLAVHALRTRYVGPGLQVDLHVLVDPDIPVRKGHEIAMLVSRTLKEKGPDVVDVLVHIEPFEEDR